MNQGNSAFIRLCCVVNGSSIQMLCAAALQALVAADKVFGSTINTKGYKVIKGCGVIQGDGIDISVMQKVRGDFGRGGGTVEGQGSPDGGGSHCEEAERSLRTVG